MSLRKTVAVAIATVIAAGAAAAAAAPAMATPLADEVAIDRAALDAATARYNEVQAQADAIDAQVAAASAELDRIIADQTVYQHRLQTRVVAMYRSGDAGALELLLGASSLPELTRRLDVIDRMARQDAENIEALKAARAAAAKSAEELMALQAGQAQALEAVTQELDRAKREFANSSAALREYEARVAAEAARAAAAKAAQQAKAAPDQGLTGSGEWQVGVASHYGYNFTGKGASGEVIGPYSMMVAHKTLPFGTLVEFEYNGKRAVARVADRGPFIPGRDWDLGPGVARVLGFSGVRQVRYRIISQ
ncbi:MAG: hypothetical protein EG823_04195 [Actinobacteria bacterium]|nr:hypothetical protein [Actinomycetota bacterium]